MMPAITATKSAKYRHACAERPSGTGATAIAAPIASGATTFGHVPTLDVIECDE